MAEDINKKLPENHDCKNCKLHRTIIETKIPVDQIDCDAFERIVTMLNNTDQILKTGAPESFNEKDRQAFFNSAIDKNNEARVLISEWWTEARKKYGVPESSKFDAYDGIFYHCVDKDGVPSLYGDFQPTDEYLEECKQCKDDDEGCCCCHR